MSMTKKDYELIASTLLQEFADIGGKATQYNYGRADGYRNMVFKLAVAFEADNPKFNKQKFLTDCGL